MTKKNIVIISVLLAVWMSSCVGVNDYVVINGVKWATRNVGAPGTFVDKPEDVGMFYQWNSRTGWSSTDPLDSTDGSSLNSDWNGNGASSWEAASNPCPPGWRLPTIDELESLVNAADSEWTEVNGVSGRRFGSGNNSIFLPAAGFRFPDSRSSSIGSNGSYWSSTPHGANSRSLGFFSDDVSTNYYLNRAYGMSIRPVKE